MGNIIKIPTINNDLNLSFGSELLNSQNWIVVDGEINGNDFSSNNSPISTTTNGSGSGLSITFQMESQPNFVLFGDNNSPTIGYKVGDVITLTIPANTPNLDNITEFILQTTLTQDMFSNEGDKIQYLPVFDALQGQTFSVIPPLSTLNDFWFIVVQWGNRNSPNAWKININGGNAANRSAITNSISSVFIEGATKPNSHPTLELPTGVTCQSVEWEAYTF